MTVLAATVADLYFFADLALHLLGIFQVDQGFFADQTFFIHWYSLVNFVFSPQWHFINYKI